ncbi:hypothetical protein K435DRAFT_180998 [Dendrothele bispora CBS 962.96]|uniref:RING-type domain-containing protein n=1 Tax=Dendrothele bispora (strain CBS 962.96) TaxID=1314807 RepID=A0A4S8LW69_DENBC|nr:hypothetical protein K435DRAFT_180998 [Dendrothele bispora CBS 962.96]
MLVLDPSSCCDICLDPYDSNDSNPEGSPHLIISCGHIFCKRCLSKIISMECPLCRKFFSLNNLQRLYVEQPEDPDRMKKYDLMRKLVLTCDSKEEDIVAVREEVDVWLGSKVKEGKHCSVRKTVEILDRLQRVKDQKRRHKREIKHLKRSAMRKEQELLE